MFFPVKKNLTIGLALVNSLNVSEFKAVLMHEFGHFSQRSMRFGSYVYNLNKVLYNMLYENESYGKTLNLWARWHIVLRFAVYLNIKIVQGMQYVLKKLHVNINKKHLGLSREMEFHADAIAAYYGGSNNMLSALRRLELGNNSYNTVLNLLGRQFDKGYKSDNVYPKQLIALGLFSEKHNLLIDEEGLPNVNKSIAELNNSNIIIDNQWASHPTDNDREYSLTQLNIVKPTISRSAWSLFTNIEALQEHITKTLYTHADDKIVLGIEEFKALFKDEIAASVYDKVYKGFYDSRQINAFNIEEVINTGNYPSTSFEQLFSDENCGLSLIITGLQKDITLLDAINNNKEDTTFEFNGIKHSQYDALNIKKQLAQQLADAQQKLADLDKQIFLFFYSLFETDILKLSFANDYKSIFNYQKDAETDHEMYNNIIQYMSPIYTKMKPADIESTLNKVYDAEVDVKARIQKNIQNDEISACITDKQKEDIETYLSYNWIYYDTPLYDNKSIDIFNNGLIGYITVIAERNFLKKKEVFELQLSLLNNTLSNNSIS